MAMFSWTSGSVFFIIFQLFVCPSKAQHDIVYNIDEEEPVFCLVGNLVEDLRLQVSSGASFSILEEVDSVPFAVNYDGVLYTTEVIDREVGKCSENLNDDCQFDLRILITDGSMIKVKRVLIKLHDINDHNPIFPYTVYHIDVSESVAVGTEIPMESAWDADVGVNGIHTYSLDSTYNDMFGVVMTVTLDGAKTVHLKIKQPLDRETRVLYIIVLRASDNGTPRREGTAHVYLNVVDSNDNSPQFTQSEYRKSVPENVPVGYEILNLHAEDTDEGNNAQIEYTFGSSVTSIVKEHFEIDPDDGVIRTIKNLDHERNSVFVMIIEAKDKGQNSISGFTTVTIDVTDVNDNAPVLEVSYSADIYREGNTIRIPESINVGFFIGLLLASDADSGENGQFDITIDGTHGHFKFIPDPSAPFDFAFTAGSEIDREKIPEYNLTIIAQDRGNENNRKTTVLQINIIVTDVNDFTPYFTSPVNRFVMPENNDLGYSVDTVIAIDNDEGLNAEIVYTLEEAAGYFRIDPLSGEITAMQSIDRESNASLSFYASACDKGTPQLCNTTLVVVQILDKNDNQPYFLQEKYIFEIEANAAALTLIGQVAATDEDVGMNRKLSYSLLESSENFIIERLTGQIYSKRQFDNEEKNNYRLTVVVSDSGLPAKTNYVIIEILIKDINENAPFTAFPTPINDIFFIPATAPSDCSANESLCLQGMYVYEKQRVHFL
ncbi:protocadherin-18-like [Anneissia japonica]|uniref:protocadherin-18-like n=1 Tax=Anneissia japonica TaxID=1529436 RepID=UPI001425B021|nr:protocadherin-18-like [Anneissia japonica]XP_033118442.1 protocadherin-18-like [Anneissia japonica]XP_033118443.1 protocadherin-18-like [Anneissia japonica]